MNNYKIIVLRGRYVSGWQSAISNWEQDIVPNQKEALQSIQEMCPGTFNVRLTGPAHYVPADIPLIRAKKNRSCVSQIAKVVSINGELIDAYIYNGGWPANTIELLCRQNISETLNLELNDSVTIEVRESEF